MSENNNNPIPRAIRYESSYADLTVPFYRSQSERLVLHTYLGASGEIIDYINYAQRGGFMVFSRDSIEGELHAIRLHETVESPVPYEVLDSRIDEEQPFSIVSSGEFISRNFKAPSVFCENGKAVILSDSESAELLKEAENDFIKESIETPSTLSTVESTSNLNPKGQRVFCLYLDSGNVYAGKEI